MHLWRRTSLVGSRSWPTNVVRALNVTSDGNPNFGKSHSFSHLIHLLGWSDRHTHMHARTNTHTYTHFNTDTYTHNHTYSHTLTLTSSHTYAHTPYTNIMFYCFCVIVRGVSFLFIKHFCQSTYNQPRVSTSDRTFLCDHHPILSSNILWVFVYSLHQVTGELTWNLRKIVFVFIKWYIFQHESIFSSIYNNRVPSHQ